MRISLKTNAHDIIVILSRSYETTIPFISHWNKQYINQKKVREYTKDNIPCNVFWSHLKQKIASVKLSVIVMVTERADFGQRIFDFPIKKIIDELASKQS